MASDDLGAIGGGVPENPPGAIRGVGEPLGERAPATGGETARAPRDV